MKCDVVSLANKKSGTIDLDEAVFGLEVRRDILTRAVNWQLAKSRSGNHKTKQRSEVSGTKSKPFRQKGTGRARQGTARAPQMRGGGTTFGPHLRDHSIKLPKKVRKLALKTALSAKQAEGKLVVLDAAKPKSPKTGELAKQAEGKLVVLDAAKPKSPKTGELAKQIAAFDWGRTLVIDGKEVDENFARAARNIVGVDVLPSHGANVYDILQRDTLVLTKDAVEQLVERLK